MLNKEGRAYQRHSVRNLLRLSMCHGRRGDTVEAACSESISARPTDCLAHFFLSTRKAAERTTKETLEEKTKAIEAANNEDADATS